MDTVGTRAGFDLDEAGVRALLRDQYPDLADLPLRRVKGGFDNRLWRLGDDLAVRFPQTERRRRTGRRSGPTRRPGTEINRHRGDGVPMPP